MTGEFVMLARILFEEPCRGGFGRSLVGAGELAGESTRDVMPLSTAENKPPNHPLVLFTGALYLLNKAAAAASLFEPFANLSIRIFSCFMNGAL